MHSMLTHAQSCTVHYDIDNLDKVGVFHLSCQQRKMEIPLVIVMVKCGLCPSVPLKIYPVRFVLVESSYTFYEGFRGKGVVQFNFMVPRS